MDVAIVGRRERGRLDRLKRVKEAAAEIFREKGYDAATTREIAERAGVASGTIFVYARDKRDLLMMVANEELDALSSNEFGDVRLDSTLLEQLMHLFGRRYEFWARDPKFSQSVIREAFHYTTDPADCGPHMLALRAGQLELIEKIAAHIAVLQRNGRIDPAISPARLSELCTGIYFWGIRHWAMNHLSKREGIDHLREMLTLALTGLERPAPKA